MKYKSISARFIEYVKIDSPSEQEDNFSAYLITELSAMGYRPHKDPYGNIYIDVKGDDKTADPILLNAHIDTVKHDKPIRPILKKGIITSNGETILGADNKAGIAVIMEILSILKSKNISHPDIQVIFTVEEEIGLKGAKQVRTDWIYPKIGFVLDGGDVHVIHNQAPTQMNISVEIFGRAAHAGVRPENGISAIKVASDAISKMKLGRIDLETTANIGIIEGGVATNIIPEKVTLKGEARSHNAKKLQKQVSHMEKCLNDACKKHKAKLKLNIVKAYDSFNISKSDPIVKRVEDALKSVGIKPVLKATGGGSDANIFNTIGIKSIILGVGADHVHTSVERITVKDLENSVRYILKLISSN